MGAKTWMLAHAEQPVEEVLTHQPVLRREASLQFAQSLFPNEEFLEQDDGEILFTCPPDDEVVVGDFGGAKIIAAKEFGIECPSTLPAQFIAKSGFTTLHTMHSVVDWFAFAHWRDGELVRSLSVSPDSGVIEDIGERLDFETHFWSGERPAVDDDDDYPLAFHPLELGEAALAHFFGYQIEGLITPDMVDPEDIPLMRLKRCPKKKRRSKRWWHFGRG